MQQNTQETDDIVEIDLQEVLGMLIHWLWLILLCGIITGALGFAVSYFVITPQYQSTTKVYILNKNESSTLTYSDVQLNTQLTKDYTQLITSRTVLEQVIASSQLEEDYDDFAKRITVETLTDTRIIAITVSDENPAYAQLLANEIRKVAAEHIKNVMDIQAVTVVDEANLPISPSEPSVPKWTLFGLLGGMFLCAAVLVIRFLLDDTIKSSDDIERYLGLSTLAMIPIIEEDDKKGKKKRKQIHSEGNAGKGEGTEAETVLVVEELDAEADTKEVN